MAKKIATTVSPSDDGWSQFELWAGARYFESEPITPPHPHNGPITGACDCVTTITKKGSKT